MSARADAESRHARPGTGTYVVIATLLAVLTALEVAVSYSKPMRPVLMPVLIVLAAAKFALIVMFYMHLKFDEWAFSVIFLFQLLIACFVIFSTLMLLAVFRGML